MRFIAMLLMLALAGTALAADEDLNLKGKIGVGFDSIAGASPSSDPNISGLVPGVRQPNAAVVRYWLNEKVSWEGQLAYNFNSQPAAISGTSTTGGYGIGTMLKYNFARPTPNLLVQFLVGASLAGVSQKLDYAQNGTVTTTFGMLAGTGFEAFMPFWRALSVEGSVNLQLSSSQTSSDGASQAGQNKSTLGLYGNGLSPFNVALHYYF